MNNGTKSCDNKVALGGDVRKVKEAVRNGESFLQKTYSTVSISNEPDKYRTRYVVMRAGERAYHRGETDTSSSAIYLSDNDSTATVIHEWGHAIEYQNPSIGRAARAFLERRVGGEPAQKLNDVVSHGGYRDDERGRSDRFVEAFGKDRAWYVGKDYGGRATEIMSMGMEQLYNDPAGFAKADPEFFEFVIGVLHGRIRG